MTRRPSKAGVGRKGHARPSQACCQLLSERVRAQVMQQSGTTRMGMTCIPHCCRTWPRRRVKAVGRAQEERGGHLVGGAMHFDNKLPPWPRHQRIDCSTAIPDHRGRL
jgi:hypothetical protein